MSGDILLAARTWLDGDPDPETRAQLQAMIDSEDRAALEGAMGEPLSFGTAGIRGQVGPGSSRMNRATVIKTTKGLAEFLKDQGRGDLPVVVGYDARPSSRMFAEDVVGVLAMAGLAVRFFPEVTPTPFVAYAAKSMGAGAAVVITASHNPPADNGYKVYGANAAQIIPPEDTGIAEAIAGTGPANEVPRLEHAFTRGGSEVATIDASTFDSYLRDVDRARPAARASERSIVYTPLHGVGGRFVAEMFDRAGHTGLLPVPSQFEPDGTFPTVTFPNPEEEGALDLALGLAAKVRADAVIANDPDADRLAAAVRHGGGWRRLTGNEMGALLGDYVLRNWGSDRRAIVASSIVSSPILERIAALHDAHHEVTLTGFKWIVNAGLALEAALPGVFAFGFEEALGYTIGSAVRDKDGMSAALVFSDLLADMWDDGRTVVDRLHGIWAETGLWVSAQESVSATGPEGKDLIARAILKLISDPPREVGGMAVTELVDYREGSDLRPAWLGAQDLIECRLGSSGRVLVRPSGTEPKLKIYVDLTGGLKGNVDESHRDLEAVALGAAKEVGEWLTKG